LSKITSPEGSKGQDFIKVVANPAEGTPVYMAPELLNTGNIPDPDESCDVYSYGIMSWETFAEKPPMPGHDLHTLREFVVTKQGRPDLTVISDNSTKEFLTKCWHPVPSERYTFKQLNCTELEAPWSTIISAAIAEDSKTTKEFWEACLEKSKRKDSSTVSWNDFVLLFSKYFHSNNVDTKHPEHLALKLILNVGEEDPVVKFESWKTFVEWFGPFERTAGQKLTSLLSLLLQPYFHGAMSVDEATLKLCMHLPGTYLVRFSSAKAQFTASWVERDKVSNLLVVKHFRLGKNAETIMSRVQTFVTTISKTASKKPTPCPGRPVKYEELQAEVTRMTTGDAKKSKS